MKALAHRGHQTHKHQEEPDLYTQTIAYTYQAMVRETRLMDDRLRKRKPEDRQPTATITTAKGNVIQIERMIDVKGQADSPIWRSDGLRENWGNGLNLLIS
jgi:hypothetical protein